MSADNWAVCPKCQKKLNDAGIKDISIDHTLREDYEVGLLPNGEFMIHYESNCENCDFEYMYRKHWKVELD